ncbi:YbbR-like domain-containing protein [Terrihalobacillus insolitus]|uniref:CdaR family protein n=1 Tax=Terrihalobacillus insolitus TaxID=2950438 RepID=UPI0023414239|nr:CdaR family protein [Terrihalobacillus insolitus]MDC3414785.1 CdaR family protein [Terrihalobacillus insolitus]
MDKWLKSPWFVRGVALVLAILLYTAVSLDDNTTQSESTFIPNGSDEVETVEDVPVDIRIDEEKYVVSGVPNTVTVTVQGSKSVVTPTIRQKAFGVFVDLQDLETGTHQVKIQQTGISNELSVYIEPKTVEVTIEERSTQNFDVNVEFINQSKLADGYELGEAKVTPNQVTITSSKEIVDSIAIVKAFVDVSGANEPINNQGVPVKVYDNQGNELNVRVAQPTVEVSVDVRNPNKAIPVEPATKGELRDGLTIESMTVDPEEVRVFAADEILSELDQINTEEIDLSEITEAKTIQLGLQLPDNVRKMEPKKVEVTIEVGEKEEKVFESEQIETRNLDEDYSLTFVDPTDGLLDVTAIGTSEELQNLGPEDISLSIDLSGQGPGEYEIPINLSGPDNIELNVNVENAVVQLE